MKTLTIIAGGSLPDNVPKANYYIGVDYGALWLLKKGIAPDIAIGDFDSISKKEKKYIHDHVKKYIEYPPEKDETDLELAIDEAIKIRPKEVKMYGALGRRFDHSIAATGMLLRLESHNIYGEIVDNYSKIQIVRHKVILKKSATFPYVSIVPYGSSATITLQGFVYNVRNKKILNDSTVGISNEIQKKYASVTLHNGKALIIQSRD